MKHALKFAWGLVAMLAVGCGGSGNGSSSTVAPTGTPRVECIVLVQRTNLMHPNNWSDAQLLNPQTPGLYNDLINPTIFGIQDPTNIEEGEQMVFQVVTYSSTGVRTILPNATWNSSDIGAKFGNLAANTGQYIAGTLATTTPQTIAATLPNGATYSAQYDILIDQVRLLGNVQTQGAGASTGISPLAGTILQFYNSQGLLVDSVTVAENGTFRASVPPEATTFTVVADTEPQSYQQSFATSAPNTTRACLRAWRRCRPAWCKGRRLCLAASMSHQADST